MLICCALVALALAGVECPFVRCPFDEPLPPKLATDAFRTASRAIPRSSSAPLALPSDALDSERSCRLCGCT
ncbi:hypothetical protein C8F04DRAFT_1069661 [Mycena alexandri]|uniref:Uncharacterized protein n=1 Tax=Mycena alexandri TaxID=1745969 RepID=A0AAD6TGR2_9AGAR|nr:hypothetical protein C8F04DRAFT_1069661 [Mycena alexandri]